ncbi:DUF6090 family protein [Leeuwenhoekiella nanhaiensis]|uniref:Uncharacterized protein n=1 Tax=Leeuwenhoekiella nanhaiensis TaxID=1655491 RepID=A0A2G1VNV8_9FLAO|nr:DUF6090 family protein [Leeuwenhoekiella nanhaiensis]PHQ28451.1 hypothetical protein CJ305_15170 [Leeuwenhoekiella nanhaiensis]
MIKFFRKIRLKSLTENKFGKYLTYATGEIILVVIGILIALQINNWNEDQKLEAKTQNYYEQLLVDLDKDTAFIQQIISKFESQRKAYNSYLNKFETSQLSLESIYEELLSLNTESYALSFNTSTIESLQNSGEIVLIPPQLRNKLLDLKRLQQKITLDESLDNRAKTGVTERLSMLMGTSNFSKRLENQEILKKILNMENNTSGIILGLEAVQNWMDFSERKSIQQLKILLEEIKRVKELIQKEQKQYD